MRDDLRLGEFVEPAATLELQGIAGGAGCQANTTTYIHSHIVHGDVLTEPLLKGIY